MIASASSWSLPATVELREVGPRDGLQPERPLTVQQRVDLITSLLEAGLRHIEVGAFVSPRAVPAMAQTAAVMEGLGRREGVTRTALVPNLRGAQDALEAGPDELTVTLSASEEYGRRNINMTLAQSLDQVGQICGAAAPRGVPVDAVISCAFGSPYEGEIAPGVPGAIRDELLLRGADAVTFADTTGMATPRGVRALLETVGVGERLHFHESRGTGLANTFAALLMGCTRFDTAIGGLGGSPFAKGSAGNVSTEDLVSMLDDLGIHTGVDLNRLLTIAAPLSEMVGRTLPSAVARSGPRVAVPVAAGEEA
jgi:hydroxymethylglutaryl-CoA lyase